MTKVLVTGAGGYLGSHCVEQLLKGGYTVRGTMRGDPANEAKGKTLRAFDQADGEGKLELVRADLENEHDWPRLMEGCAYVLHTASPFPLQADESIIKPAVEGTLNVLKAASQCESVKKVVLTSSCAAVAFGQTPGRVFTEDDWSNLESPNITHYIRSKTLAEKAAWDYVKTLPADHHLKLTVINPCFIVGPVLTNEQGTSVTFFSELLNGLREEELKFKRPVPQFAMVDVRDVAKAHLLAMTNEKSDGHRIIMYTAGLWRCEIAKLIEKEFGPKGYEIPTAQGTIPPNAKSLELAYDNSKARNLLGMDQIPIEKSIIDMCYSMIEKGIVKKKEFGH